MPPAHTILILLVAAFVVTPLILALMLARWHFADHHHGFPRVIRDYWYCGRWALHRADYPDTKTPAWPVEGKALFDPFSCKGPFIKVYGDDSGRVDGLIPAYRLGDKVGLYEARNPHYRPGTGSHSDWASWDNGLNIDLYLVRVVGVNEVPSLQENA